MTQIQKCSHLIELILKARYFKTVETKVKTNFFLLPCHVLCIEENTVLAILTNLLKDQGQV